MSLNSSWWRNLPRWMMRSGAASSRNGSPDTTMTMYPNQSQTWEEKAFRKSVGMRQAAYMMDAERLARNADNVRRLTKKTQDGTLGQPTDEPMDESESSGRGISVGDVYHPAPPPQNDWGPLIASVLVGASIFGGAYMLTRPDDRPIPQEPPPAAEEPDTNGVTDVDTELGLELE